MYIYRYIQIYIYSHVYRLQISIQYILLLEWLAIEGGEIGLLFDHITFLLLHAGTKGGGAEG